MTSCEPVPTTTYGAGWPDHREKMAYCVFFGLYFCLRLPFLSGIPPYTADEGLLALPAKNWVLFGDPFLDGWSNLARFPLYTVWLTALFRCAGVSILAARVSSVLFGAISMLLLARLARRIRPSQGVLAALLFAVDFVLVRYQRYALVESLQILLLLTTVSLWTDRRGTVRLMGGVALAAAICTKATSVYLVAPLLLHDFWRRRAGSPIEQPDRTRPENQLGPYACAVFLTGVVYAAAHLAAPVGAKDLWGIYWWGDLPGFSDVPHVAATMVIGTPVVMLGTTLALIAGGRQVGSRKGQVHARGGGRSLLVVAAVWFMAGLAFLAAQRLHPVRYYVTLLPAAILLASWWLDRWLREAEVRSMDSARSRAGRLAWMGVFAFIVFYPVVLFAWFYGPGGGSDWSGKHVGDYIRGNLPRESVLMGRAQYGIEIPNRYYDMTIVGGMALSDSLLSRLGVDYVLFDDGEWRQFDRRLGLGTAGYLATKGRLVRRVGQIEIWRVRPPS